MLYRYNDDHYRHPMMTIGRMKMKSGMGGVRVKVLHLHHHTFHHHRPGWEISSSIFMIIPTGLYCIQRLGNISQTFIASTFVYKTVSSTDYRNKQAKLEDDKTFAFI